VSFRRRIALLTGAAVAVSILLASSLAYVTVRGQLLGQIDDSLRGRAQDFATTFRQRPAPPPAGARRPRFPQRRGDVDFYFQILGPSGLAQRVPFAGRTSDRLPIAAEDRAIARGDGGTRLRDVSVRGARTRLLTAPVPGGGAVQLARPLSEVDTTLRNIRLILLVVALGGIAMAALLGRLIAARTMGPLARLTSTAEHVTATQDLGRRIDDEGPDEIGRLAASFNEMLDTLQESMRALDASVHAQRQLIADASHELRTPVTSLRTNIEVLGGNPDLDPELRARLLDRATHQVEELTALMNDLIDLARGEEPEAAPVPVELDELVAGAVGRAQRHGPDQEFVVDLEPMVVAGAHDRLARAVNNLLDNAVAWNAAGSPIEVRLAAGRLTVRDHGPGFADDEVGHVFDRFFRGSRARERPGSGLGLAIARQAVLAHGGAIAVSNAPDGGALVEVDLTAAVLLAGGDGGGARRSGRRSGGGGASGPAVGAGAPRGRS
jgi:two-component system sensor histidine kinase MprB